MKITKSELKQMIRETLREELAANSSSELAEEDFAGNPQENSNPYTCRNMKMYCVEHSKNDCENAYFTSETQAVRHHIFLKDLMANGEIEQEDIWITTGDMTEDGYSAEGVWYEI